MSRQQLELSKATKHADVTIFCLPPGIPRMSPYDITATKGEIHTRIFTIFSSSHRISISMPTRRDNDTRVVSPDPVNFIVRPAGFLHLPKPPLHQTPSRHRDDRMSSSIVNTMMLTKISVGKEILISLWNDVAKTTRSWKQGSGSRKGIAKINIYKLWEWYVILISWNGLVEFFLKIIGISLLLRLNDIRLS